VGLSVLFFYGLFVDHLVGHLDLCFVLFGVNVHAFHVLLDELLLLDDRLLNLVRFSRGRSGDGRLF
jgi:hypothetical protein